MKITASTGFQIYAEMVADFYKNIALEDSNKYPEFTGKLVKAILTEQKGNRDYRMIGRNYFCQGNEHILWDSPVAPERQGQTYESQLLGQRMNGFLAAFGEKDQIQGDIGEVFDSIKTQTDAPKSYSSVHMVDVNEMLKTNKKSKEKSSKDTMFVGQFQKDKTVKKRDGTDYRTQTSIEEYVLRGDSDYIRRMSGWFDLIHHLEDAVDITKKPVYIRPFNRHYPTKSMDDMLDFIPMQWSDTLKNVVEIEPSSVMRAVQPFILSQRNSRFNVFSEMILSDAERAGLIGKTGFRSLSVKEPDYQPHHRYHLDKCSYGTTSLGDVLVWTAGRLGDNFYDVNRRTDLLYLLEALSDRCLNWGVPGALPEAENAEYIPSIDNTVWSPVQAASVSEFVRLTTEKLFGFVKEGNRKIRFIPAIPDEWGNYRIEIEEFGGIIWIERYSSVMWQVGQTGIEPEVVITIDIVPERGMTAAHSLAVLPGERIRITFKKHNQRYWKGEQRWWDADPEGVQLWGLPDKVRENAESH